jgi:hypothetical protein
MPLPLRKYIFGLLFFLSFSFYGQDTIRYRNTSFHGSVSDFVLLSPQYPQYGSFFPSAMLSLKSSSTDSLHRPLKNLSFSILVGIAASRYLFFEEKFFINLPDKSPYHVLSKRFWGGFGINYRRQLSKKLILDIDLAPSIQIIVDKSEETKTDTSGYNSLGFDNIYQGIHLNAYCKLEYKLPGNFSPFFSFSASLPLSHTIARQAGDEPYYNTFKGQLFIGIGLSYYYRGRHIIEPDEKMRAKP